MTPFAMRVLRWYDANGRKNLPWQSDVNPYRVWVSEIMLQQTQVQTVIPYFERFMRSFPDLASLADANIDAVLQHWSGLGYYARARNLHRAAQLIRDRHDGEFPLQFDAVLDLPGIGRSTAGAILALATQQRHAILDGNVKRVLARHRAISGWPGDAQVASALWECANEFTPKERVAEYTQAIMDLGATVCTRTRPACNSCPVAIDCMARGSDSVELYPGRKAKRVKPLKQTIMVMAISDNSVYLERRPPAGIWGGLWSLPEVQDVDDWCRQVLQLTPGATEEQLVLRHSFSHYDLDIQPVIVRVAARSRTVADSADATWHALDDEPPGGIASPVQQLLDTLKTNRHVTNC